MKYELGNIFSIEGEPYLLAQIEANTISLIHLLNDNRFALPLRITDLYNITCSDIKLLADTDCFEPYIVFVAPSADLYFEFIKFLNKRV